MTAPKQPTKLIKQLYKIQKELEAPKNQYNKFGNYKYRNCEDILEAVKPFLNDCVVLLQDRIVKIGKRYYVKATATLTDGVEEISNLAYAREAKNKKGMDVSQITGAASSYARKYAMNGLFAIDDGRDADSKDNSQPVVAKTTDEPTNNKGLVLATERQRKMIFALGKELGKTGDETKKIVKKWINLESFNDMTMIEAKKVIDGMQKKVKDKVEADEVVKMFLDDES